MQRPVGRLLALVLRLDVGVEVALVGTHVGALGTREHLGGRGDIKIDR